MVDEITVDPITLFAFAIGAISIGALIALVWKKINEQSILISKCPYCRQGVSWLKHPEIQICPYCRQESSWQ